MSDMGYINFDGIECVYFEKDGIIELIAKNDEHNRELRACCFNRNYMIEYSRIRGMKCHAYINDASAYINGHMELHAKYIFEVLAGKPVTHMQITGDDIDIFFNPSRFFFSLSQRGTEKVGDIVYSKENADHWKINYKGTNIEISLSYGEILRDGIRSDLKLHPRLTMSFPSTNDWAYLYELYRFVVKFLQIVLYKRTHGHFKVELCSKENEQSSYLGELFDYADTPLNSEKELREINYNNYSKYMERLWQFVANDPNCDLSHFPDMHLRFSGKDYTPLDLFYIFTAFEYECDSRKDIYNSPDETLIQGIKEQMLTKVSECGYTDDIEKRFLDDVTNSIRNQGKTYGQKKKIITAYTVLSKVFANSLKNIFYEHPLEDAQELSGKDINTIAKFLTSKRGKIAHGSSVSKFSDAESQFIHFFEILTYSMLLKRAELSEYEIEMIIGAVFYCNAKMRDHFLLNG